MCYETKANGNPYTGAALNAEKLNGAIESTFLRARGNYEGHVDECHVSGGYIALGGKSVGMPFDNWGTLVDFEGGTGASIQIASAANNIDNYIRSFRGDYWGEWEYIGTKTEQLVMQNGWIPIYSMSVTRSGNICTIYGVINSGVVTPGTIIFNLPNSRYYPKRIKWINVPNLANVAASIVIDIGGVCKIERIEAGFAHLMFDISYNCEEE